MTIRSAKSPAPISTMPPRQIHSPQQIAEGGFHNEEQVRYISSINKHEKLHFEGSSNA